MSYANFKPTVWSKYIQHDLEKHLVYKADCDFMFEGEAKQGKRVKILGVGRPTIGTYEPGKDITGPESIQDSSVYLDIDQWKYFNFAVDDVDKAQSMDGLMPALMTESTRAMAEVQDRFCAEKMAKEAGKKSASAVISDAKGAIAAVDTAFEYLWGNGVRLTDKTVLYVTPWFYNLIKGYLVDAKTDNDKLILSGVIGGYNNAKVKMTNLAYNDKTDDHMILKTTKAFAFCNGIDKVESYTPEKAFSDAVKGLHTYGGKMVRPKEVYVIKGRKA